MDQSHHAACIVNKALARADLPVLRDAASLTGPSRRRPTSRSTRLLRRRSWPRHPHRRSPTARSPDLRLVFPTCCSLRSSARLLDPHLNSRSNLSQLPARNAPSHLPPDTPSPRPRALRARSSSGGRTDSQDRMDQSHLAARMVNETLARADVPVLRTAASLTNSSPGTPGPPSTCPRPRALRARSLSGGRTDSQDRMDQSHHAAGVVNEALARADLPVLRNAASLTGPSPRSPVPRSTSSPSSIRPRHPHRRSPTAQSPDLRLVFPTCCSLRSSARLLDPQLDPVPTCPSSPPAMPQLPPRMAPRPARAPCRRASFPRAHGFPPLHVAP